MLLNADKFQMVLDFPVGIGNEIQSHSSMPRAQRQEVSDVKEPIRQKAGSIIAAM
jgi:hypothetical protein